MKTKSTAALIVTYARLDGVLNLIESLRNSGVLRIYVAIDGPRNSQTEEIQLHLIDELSRISSEAELDIRIKRNQNNVGSAINVISALDWISKEEDFFVVLEDDLKISETFIEYVESFRPLLDLDDVYMISGTNMFECESNENAFWSTYPIVWGWATSSAKWTTMKNDLFTKQKLGLSLLEYSFWSVGKKRALHGFIDAWDVPLAGNYHAQNRKTIMPKYNQVSNIGADEHALHTTEDTWPLGLALSNRKANMDSGFEFKQQNNLDSQLKNRIFKMRYTSIVTNILFLLISQYFKLSGRKTNLSPSSTGIR